MERVIQHTNSLHDKAVIHFSYDMHIEYENSFKKEFFTIKAIPISNQRQIIRNLSYKLTPDAVFSTGVDSFGNRMIYGKIEKEHKFLNFCVEGNAQIEQVLFEDYANENEIFKFRHPYGLNKYGNSIQEYFNSLKWGLEENTYVNAVYLMRCLHHDFIYKKGITDTKTGAEEAWILGQGVCQDYAHIFIALCHLAGIPARYVVGIIAGEGESHAWVEIAYRGLWIGMDPTNDLLVAGLHIKFGHGRDSSDCQLNRGILYGGGKQLQKVHVTVREGQDD